MKNVPRTRLLTMAFLVAGSLLVGRLFYLQVIQHQKYETLAAESQNKRFELPAERGEVYSQLIGGQTVPLVLNEPVYTLFADPKIIQNDQEIINQLRRIAGGDLVDNYESLLQGGDKRYVILAKQINQDQADIIEKKNLTGIGLKPTEKRVYPEGNMAARMLGYVNTAGEGQYGLEGALDKRLSGEPGLLSSLTDASGVPLTGHGGENVLVEPKNGDDIVLSIDRNIQAFATQALKKGLENAKATKGSVLVMDPQTGKVLAMASLPNYNPAKYYEVAQNNYDTFLNPIVSDPYEPGSVTKALTMAAGINEGVVSPKTTYANKGFSMVDGVKIKNATPGKYNGERTMTEVLQFSLNSGAIHVLRQLGGEKVNDQARERLYNYFSKHYYLGKPTGVAQANENTGQLLGPNEGYGRDVRYATMSFGQGFSTTMLRTATAFSSIINGGTLYTPSLIAGELKDDGSVDKKSPAVEKSNVVSKATSATMRDMLYEARHRVLGSFDKDGYIVGGKTSTSQTIDPETGEYREDKTIASYTGFGGDETPDYVVMVRVDNSQLPGFGGTVAAQPIFAEISNWLLEYMRIPKVK